eukprot:gene11009-8319_t
MPDITLSWEGDVVVLQDDIERAKKGLIRLCVNPDSEQYEIPAGLCSRRGLEGRVYTQRR